MTKFAEHWIFCSKINDSKTFCERIFGDLMMKLLIIYTKNLLLVILLVWLKICRFVASRILSYLMAEFFKTDLMLI